MSSPYTSPTLSNYNASPPPDDGSNVETNALKWSNHLDKIGDPLKTFAQAIDANVQATFTAIYGTTASEDLASVTPVNLEFLPLNVFRYDAKADGTTDDFTAINNAKLVSDQAYFNGEDYTVLFPPSKGNTGRYMTSQGFVIDRNGTRWRGEMSVRRVQPTAIAFLASATDTLLMDVTGEACAFDNLDFEGFSGSDQAGKLFELHPKTRFPTAAEISAHGLDAGTLYNFEDVDCEFNNCNFQFSTVAIQSYGRGLYIDTCEFFDVTVGWDMDREATFQEGAFDGQDAQTGMRGFAVRTCRFHGMGIDSACIRNVGAQKDNMTGVIFIGNLIDTFATVMYGPMQDARFDCVHTGIRRKVFDAHTTTGLGDASGAYVDVAITGTYNTRTFRNAAGSLTADNFLYCDGFTNLNINANVRDIFKDVIRSDGDGDTLNVNGSFYDVMSDGATAAYALVKLNGGDFKNINAAGAVQTGSFANNDALVQAVGTFTIQGLNVDGLSFDPTEWVPFSSAVSQSPITSADATPSMMGRKTLRSNGTTAITDFDDGEVDDEFDFICETSNVVITDNAAIVLSGSANYTMTPTDTLRLKMFTDQVWTEVSRSVN